MNYLDVIFQYLKSIIFVMGFIFYAYSIGKATCKTKAGFSKKLIVGYVIHSAVIGVIGVVVQFLQLSWMMFAIANILSVAGLSIFSFIKIRKSKNEENDVSYFLGLKKHIVNYWFVYVIATILVFFSLMSIHLHLFNNHLDDGLYLLRIAQLPHLEHPFSIIHSSGFEKTGLSSLSGIAYLFNVFDLEASVYSYFLDIPASVFARFALNLLNYYLFLQSIMWLIEVLLSRFEVKIKKRNYQYIIVIVLFFSFYDLWIVNYLKIMNDFLFNSGMWYGSSIVRCLGIFIMFIPLIESKFEFKKQGIYFILACITLLSKSSIALPLLFVGFIIYLFVWLYSINKKLVFIPIIIVVGICTLVYTSIGLPNSEWELIKSSQDTTVLELIFVQIQHYITANMGHPIFWITIVIFLLSFFWYKNKIVLYWNLILLLLALFIFLPVLNYAFIKFSIYNFVAGRTITLLFYTFISTAFIYLSVFLIQVFKKNYIVNSVNLLIAIILLAVFTINYQDYIGIKKGLYYNFKNPYFVPQSTLDLSNKLDALAEDYGDNLYVLSIELVGIYDFVHPLATTLRINATDIYSVSAIPRFSAGSNEEFKEFTQDDQDIYGKFTNEPETYFTDFKNLLKKYRSINCVVTITDSVDSYMEELDYSKTTLNFENVNYFIYLRNN